MSDYFSETTLESAAAALRHIPDADDRRTLLRILCGADFEPLRARCEPAIDWDRQPAWAVYAAMDRDGSWWVFDRDIEPENLDGAWITYDTDDLQLERMVDPPDEWIGHWHESLRVRPGTKEHDLEMA